MTDEKIINYVRNRCGYYDIVVSTTVVPDNIKDKVIMGLPLLTGIGIDGLFDEIEAKIKA